MRSRAARLINRLLAPLGLGLTSAEMLASQRPLREAARRHAQLATEVEALLRETIFTDLPPRAMRAELLADHDGTTVTEAMYVLDCLHKSLPLAGDVCEFGVARGASSVVIANDMIDSEKTLWLFDSFQGLPRPTEKDVLIDDIAGLKSIAAYEGKMAYAADLVQERLARIGFPPARTKIVAGFVPASFDRADLPAAVCFAYVDFDFYEPIRDVLQFLESRLPPGAYVVVDDYGYFSSGAQTAVDEFVTEQGGRYSFTLPHQAAGKFCILRKRAS